MATKQRKSRQIRRFSYPSHVVFGVLSQLQAVVLMLNVLAREQPTPAEPAHRLYVLATKAAISEIVAGVKDAQGMLQR